MFMGRPSEQLHTLPGEPLPPVAGSEEADAIASAEEQAFRLQEEAAAHSGARAHDPEEDVAHGEQDRNPSRSTEQGSVAREDGNPEIDVDREEQTSKPLLLLKAVSQKPSVFYVRQDDWIDALERRQSDVRLCDEFGQLLQAPPDRPRAKTTLRVSTVRAYYQAVVIARSLEPVEPEQLPEAESSGFSDETQFPAAETGEAPPNTDDGIPEATAKDQAQNLPVLTARRGDRRGR